MQESFSAVVDHARSTVRLCGECDMDDVAAIHQAVAALGLEPEASLVLDLSELAYMGSAGLSALIEVQASYPNVQLRHVPDSLQTVLRVTGMDAFFASGSDNPPRLLNRLDQHTTTLY